MKTMKFFAVAVVTLMLGMTSCNNNDDDKLVSPVDVTGKTITLKMGNAPHLTTRSDSESGLEKSAVLSKGVVIFVNGDDITRYVNLTESGGSSTYTEPTDADIEDINILSMTSDEGVEFERMNADKVYIIGNRTASQLAGLLPTQDGSGVVSPGFKMSDLLKASSGFLDVTDEGDMNNGEHKNVALFGKNTFTHDSGINYKAKVDLVPIVARVEIAEIFASGVTFKLSGIFINNYYTAAQVDGTIPAAAILQNNLNIVTNYVENYQAPALRDWASGALGTQTGNITEGFLVKPTATWGYNVFAAKNIEATDKNLPRIILRLTDVKDAEGIALTNGKTEIVDQYITVKGFNDGTNSITEFKAGYVYKIAKLSFDISNLTEEPEIGDRIINATVIVSVRPWTTGGTVNPEL